MAGTCVARFPLYAAALSLASLCTCSADPAPVSSSQQTNERASAPPPVVSAKSKPAKPRWTLERLTLAAKGVDRGELAERLQGLDQELRACIAAYPLKREELEFTMSFDITADGLPVSVKVAVQAEPIGFGIETCFHRALPGGGLPTGAGRNKASATLRFFVEQGAASE